jgi:hypothetical protein
MLHKLKIGQRVFLLTLKGLEEGIIVNVKPDLKIMLEDSTIQAADFDHHFSYEISTLIRKLKRSQNWTETMANFSATCGVKTKSSMCDILWFVYHIQSITMPPPPEPEESINF